MSLLPVHPDVIGHMAAQGGTDEPFGMCPSCQRALLYGGLLYNGAALNEMEAAVAALEKLDILAAGQHLSDAMTFVRSAVKTALEVATVDFHDNSSLIEDMTEDEWRTAMGSFFAARTDHYTDAETGTIVFEPHGEDGDLASTGS